MKRPNDTFAFPPELGKRLRDLRLQAGLTQSELAQAIVRTDARWGHSLGVPASDSARYSPHLARIPLRRLVA